MNHVDYLAHFNSYLESGLMTRFKDEFTLDQSNSKVRCIANGLYEIGYEVRCHSMDLDPSSSSFTVKVEKNDTLRTLDFFVVDRTPYVGRQGTIYHFHKNTISGELKFCGVDENEARQSGLGWLFGALMAAYLAWEAWYGFYRKPAVEAYPVVVLASEDTQEQEWMV